MVSAPSDRREDLLKELEHFAFRGIPNVSSPRLPDAVAAENLEKIDQIEDKSLQQVFTLFEPRNFLPTLCLISTADVFTYSNVHKIDMTRNK